MPQVTAEVDVSSSYSVGAVVPQQMPLWPEYGLRVTFRLAGPGPAVVRLIADDYTVREITLPVPSGYKTGETSRTLTVLGRHTSWSWHVDSLASGSSIHCRAEAIAEDEPVEANAFREIAMASADSAGNLGALGFQEVQDLSQLRTLIADGSTPLFKEADDISTERKAAQFLQQTTVGGPTYAEIQAAAAVGSRRKWINDQFALRNTKGYVLRCFKDKAITDYGSFSGADLNKQDSALLELMYEEPALRTKLVWALSKLYVITHPGGAFSDRSEVYAWASWWDRLDNFVFGNWRDLIESITYSPHMSQMLTFRANAKSDGTNQPDENYAREIMQLFSIGLVMLNDDGTAKLDASGQPIPSYSNDDIRQVARCLTGLCVWDFTQSATQNYAFDTNSGRSKFQSVITRGAHYQDMAADPTICLKHYLPAYEYGSKYALGGLLNVPEGTPPEQNLSMLHDALFNHPNLPIFFSIRMIQHLVTSNPSPGYVSRVAAAFKNNGAGVRGDLKAVWMAILTDPEAAEDGRRNPRFGRVRDSFDVWMNGMRSLNRRTSAGEVRIYQSGSSVTSYVADLGPTWYRMQPSIFSAYDPLHSPDELRDVAPGFLAPELQAWNDGVCTRAVIRLQAIINTFEPRDTADANSQTASYAELPVTGTAAELIERLNLMFCGGRMTYGLRADLTAVLTPMGVADSTAQQNRVAVALQLIITSTDFLLQV